MSCYKSGYWGQCCYHHESVEPRDIAVSPAQVQQVHHRASGLQPAVVLQVLQELLSHTAPILDFSRADTARTWTPYSFYKNQAGLVGYATSSCKTLLQDQCKLY